MLMKIFCVYDSKVEDFGQPFFANSKGEALREFAEVANDTNTKIGKYPSDFTLFEMGDYDRRRGKFDLYITPVSLGVAVEHLKDGPLYSYKPELNKASGT